MIRRVPAGSYTQEDRTNQRLVGFPGAPLSLVQYLTDLESNTGGQRYSLPGRLARNIRRMLQHTAISTSGTQGRTVTQRPSPLYEQQQQA